PPAAPQPPGPPPVQNLFIATGNGIPNPVVSDASRWVNLTATTTTTRLTLSGQTGQPPDPNKLPGPNDDFRLNFPQSGVTWSDLALTYIDDSNPPTVIPGLGNLQPVLYAALGTAGAYTWNPIPNNGPIFPYSDNAVYRTENPNLAPMDDAEGVT